MISTSKDNGFINNLVGLCLLRGYNHNIINQFKKQISTHAFINNKCTNCDFDLNQFRRDISDEYKNDDKEYIIGLSCNERIIKKMLE